MVRQRGLRFEDDLRPAFYRAVAPVVRDGVVHLFPFGSRDLVPLHHLDLRREPGIYHGGEPGTPHEEQGEDGTDEGRQQEEGVG